MTLGLLVIFLLDQTACGIEIGAVAVFVGDTVPVCAADGKGQFVNISVGQVSASILYHPLVGAS